MDLEEDFEDVEEEPTPANEYVIANNYCLLCGEEAGAFVQHVPCGKLWTYCFRAGELESLRQVL